MKRGGTVGHDNVVTFMVGDEQCQKSPHNPVCNPAKASHPGTHVKGAGFLSVAPSLSRKDQLDLRC